jgi:hypothetical protein
MPFQNAGLAVVELPIAVPLPSTPSEWLTPPVYLRAKGGVWPIVFTHRALLLCEHVTSTNMLGASMIEPSATLLRGMLYGALAQAKSGLSIDDAGQIIGRKKSAREAIVAGWVNSMPRPSADEEDDKDEEDDTDAEAKEPPGWVDVWASVRYELGLGFEEFLDLTPRMLRALQVVRLARLQREELMNGMVIATIENFSPNHPKEAVQPESFMFHPYKRKPGSDRIWGEDLMREVRKYERKSKGK